MWKITWISDYSQSWWGIFVTNSNWLIQCKFSVQTFNGRTDFLTFITLVLIGLKQVLANNHSWSRIGHFLFTLLCRCFGKQMFSGHIPSQLLTVDTCVQKWHNRAIVVETLCPQSLKCLLCPRYRKRKLLNRSIKQ